MSREVASEAVPVWLRVLLLWVLLCWYLLQGLRVSTVLGIVSYLTTLPTNGAYTVVMVGALVAFGSRAGIPFLFPLSLSDCPEILGGLVDIS